MADFVYLLPLVIFIGLGLWLVPKVNGGIDSAFNSIFRKGEKLKAEELTQKALIFRTELPWAKIDSAVRLVLSKEEPPIMIRAGWRISDSDGESRTIAISFGNNIVSQFTSLLSVQESDGASSVRYEVVSYLERNGLPSGLKQMEYLRDLVNSTICGIDSAVKVEVVESK
ncbi:hypothetical protein [Actinomyces mediterranea]|uniref:hypothetical protein n=1 Tax=Actinomyces mediterranea TaxID=1871028 RepID=UPI00101AE4CF|nr:hypothetical protein [Actinomyces mediterranea]